MAKYTRPQLAEAIRKTVPGYEGQDDETVLAAAFSSPRAEEFKSWLAPEPPPPPAPPTWRERFTDIGFKVLSGEGAPGLPVAPTYAQGVARAKAPAAPLPAAAAGPQLKPAILRAPAAPAPVGPPAPVPPLKVGGYQLAGDLQPGSVQTLQIAEEREAAAFHERATAPVKKVLAYQPFTQLGEAILRTAKDLEQANPTGSPLELARATISGFDKLVGSAVRGATVLDLGLIFGPMATSKAVDAVSGTNWFRKLTTTERGMVLSKFPTMDLPDAQLLEVFKNQTKGVQKAMAVHNPRMREILQTGISSAPKPPAPAVAPAAAAPAPAAPAAAVAPVAAAPAPVAAAAPAAALPAAAAPGVMIPGAEGKIAEGVFGQVVRENPDGTVVFKVDTIYPEARGAGYDIGENVVDKALVKLDPPVPGVAPAAPAVAPAAPAVAPAAPAVPAKMPIVPEPEPGPVAKISIPEAAALATDKLERYIIGRYASEAPQAEIDELEKIFEGRVSEEDPAVGEHDPNISEAPGEGADLGEDLANIYKRHIDQAALPTARPLAEATESMRGVMEMFAGKKLPNVSDEEIFVVAKEYYDQRQGLIDKYKRRGKPKIKIPAGRPLPASAGADLETVYTMPLEKLEKKILDEDIQPPPWKSQEQISADMKKYPGGEAWRKWAAEAEINSKLDKHSVPQETIQKFKLENDVDLAIDAAIAYRADAVKEYTQERGGKFPMWNLARSLGGINRDELLRYLQIETGKDWKGREFPEELAPFIRVKGGVSPGYFTQAAYQAGRLKENDITEAIERLAQDQRVKQAVREGRDLSEVVRAKRDMTEFGRELMSKRPKDIPGQTFIPGSGPATPVSKIRPENFVDQENFLAQFQAAPEAAPELFPAKLEAIRAKKEKIKGELGLPPSDKPSDLSGRAWGAELPLEPVGKPAKIYKADIIKFAEKAFDVPVYGRATIRMGDAVGKFFPKGRYIRQKTWGELDVLAHEVAHAIDATLWKHQFSRNFSKAAVKELQALDYDQRKRRAFEGFAEWFRYKMTSDKHKALAPVFTQEFEAKIGGGKYPRDIAGLKKMFMDWKGLGALGRVKHQIDNKGETLGKTSIPDKVTESGREFYRAWVDKFDNLKIVEREGGIKPRGIPYKSELWGLSPFEKLTRFSGKINAIAESWVFNDAVDLDGNVIGPSLIKALEPAIDILPTGFVDKDQFENFRAYAVAKRGLDRARRGFETGFDVADMQYIVDKYKTPAWDQAVKNVGDWYKNLYSLLLGRTYTAAEIKAITEADLYYLSFSRAGKQGLGGGASKVLQPGRATQSYFGSGRPIINPFESAARDAYKIVDIGIKAEIAQTMADYAELYPEAYGRLLRPVNAPQKSITFTAEKLKDYLTSEGIDLADLDLDKMVSIFQVAAEGKGNVIPIIRRNGKRQFYEIDEKLYDALKDVGVQHFGRVVKFLKPFATMQRLGATGLNAAFSLLRNPLKDWATFAVFNTYTRNPVKILADLTKGTFRGVFPDALAKRWIAAGGEMSTFFGNTREGAYRAYDEVLLASGKLPSKTLMVAKHPIRAIQRLFSIPEIGPRLAEFYGVYNKLEKEHPELPETVRFNRAVNASQDVTINFTRSGYYGREVNEAAAFFNAASQGLDKVAREIKKDPTGFMLKGFTLLAPPALYQWWKNKDKDWYKNLPYAYKYNNIFIETPVGVVRIPQPFDLGIIFQGIPVAIADYAHRKDPDSFKGIGQMIGAQVPNPTPSMLGPMIDLAVDRNYAGVPIEGTRLKAKPVEARVKPDTMAIAQGAAKALQKFGVPLSAVQIDYLLNDYGGGFFRRTGLTGSAIREPADIPVLGTLFLRAPERPRRQIQKFFDERKELEAREAADLLTPKETARLLRLDNIYRYGLKVKFKKIKDHRENGDMDFVNKQYRDIQNRLNRLYDE